MATSQTERPEFFEEQYLGAADLTAVVDYARTQQARFALGAHTWGIAAGLQLKETPLPDGSVAVCLLPGYAWDGYGRPIVVLSPYRLPEERFSQFTFEAALDAEGQGRLVPVWLRYQETATALSNSILLPCDRNIKGTRIQETFALEFGPRNESELTSGLNVAGRALTNRKAFLREFDSAASLISDETVPFQIFPDAYAHARWLIPIGFVRWQPVPNQVGHFVPRNDGGDDPDSDKIRRVRRYIGVVAEEIAAADGVIRLHRRTDQPADSSFTPPTLQDDSDLVWVEGNLRTEGDNKICGGSADFRDSAGRDFDVPMRIERSDTDANARTLRVLIGPKDQLTNTFAVSVQDGETFQDRFVVLSGGNVGIGTKTPTDHLQVVGDLRISGLARKPDGGGWTIASDARLKQNVQPLKNALELLLQLQGVRFQWKDPNAGPLSGGDQLGLVAQEVEKVFPEWVTQDSNGFREVTVRGFEALVIEALRELKSELEDIKAALGQKTSGPTRKKAQPRKTKKQPNAKS